MRNKNLYLTISILRILILCIWPSLLSAQQPFVDEAKSLFPEANAIFLNKVHHFRIYLENNKLVGSCSVNEQLLVNKDGGLGHQKESIITSKFIEVSNIVAYTLIPKGNGYEKRKVEKIELKDESSDNIFYDDNKAYNFIYPSVQSGAILNLSYERKYEEPRFMGRYFWIDHVPNMESELVVSVENGININYKLFNCEKRDVIFTKEEKKKETIYRWKMRKVNSVPSYFGSPGYAYYEPNIVFYITDYKVNGEEKKLLGTPKELYTWYIDLQKNVNKSEDKELKKLTDSLVNGITDELEKVKKVFYWVQDNIAYLAIEDGLGGFIPRDAGLVCSRKFGDCKDMASIITEMLRMAGVPSYLTWIGSRDIPYTYTDLPTPSVDNHMIATYRDKNGKWIFLDATGKDAPYDLTTSFILGKQAMIGINADSFILVTVPVRDTSVSQVVDSVTLEINGNVVSGKGKALLTGYDRLNYIYATDHLNADERLILFKNYFHKGNNKTHFTDIVIKGDDRTAPSEMSYSFTLSDYARINSTELYINLNLGNDLGIEILEKDRRVPLSLKHITKKKWITTLQIPSGYRPEFIPENSSLENEYMGHSNRYSLIGDKITVVTEVYINTLLLNMEDFDKFNSVISSLQKANKQSVSLIKL